MIYFSKIFLFLVLIAFSYVTNAQTYKEKEIKSLISSYNFNTEQNTNYPTQKHDDLERSLGLSILNFDYMINNGRSDGGPNKATTKRYVEFKLDYYNNECLLNSKSTYCSAYIENQNKYKADYGVVYQPVAPVYPKIDLVNYTYTMPDGRIYDLKKGEYLNAPVKSTADATTTVEANSENIEPKTESNMQCEWIGGSPKKELTGVNCNSNICTAMVVCNKSGRKIKRLATCSSDLCAVGKATECAVQLGYASYPVSFNSNVPTNINSNKNDKSKSRR